MIEITDLHFGYTRENLFSALNLSLGSGNICGLFGKNGAGKTTLLKLMAGLLFPKHGDIQILDHHPRDRSPLFLEELILLQEEFSLPSVSAAQYEGLYAPFYPRFDPALFAQYISEFELDPERNLKDYSYGQKKKFLLAFGLATDCRLLLLDEPTNGLDIPSKRQFRKALASVLTEDRSVIISTHQARDLENLIDPVIILDEGQIIFHHTLEEISNHLSVQRRAQPPDPEEALYAEKMLGGYLVVTKNTEGEETHMELELLFNTVIQSHERLATLFTEEGTHA
jgi:ABC-2 type transport system ATP-binding protein